MHEIIICVTPKIYANQIHLNFYCRHIFQCNCSCEGKAQLFFWQVFFYVIGSWSIWCAQRYKLLNMMLMILFFYSASSNYALSTLQLLKHELIYRLFFTNVCIQKAAIVGVSIISLTPNLHTQWGGREFYFKSFERPGWDSNTRFQSLVTSTLDHYATI